MAVFGDQGVPLMVMMCTPPFPVLFTYLDPPPPRKVLRSVLEDLSHKLGDSFTGVTGNKALSSALVRTWEEMTGAQSEVKIAMRIYKLLEVDPPPGIPGKVRKIAGADRELLLKWYEGFIKDTSGEGDFLIPSAM